MSYYFCWSDSDEDGFWHDSSDEDYRYQKHRTPEQQIGYDFLCAARRGNLEKAKSMLQTYGLSHSPEWGNGYVLLRDALENRHDDVAKLLLDAGAPVNNKNQNPVDTPLHYAADGGYQDIVRLLLVKGARVNAKNKAGYTPLYTAVQANSTEVFKMLLSYRASVYASEEGRDSTLLHLAAGNGNADIVQSLVNQGSNVNACTTGSYKRNYTALHFAAIKGSLDVAKVLLSRGADVSAKTGDDKTAFQYACIRGHASLVKLFLEHGAEVDEVDKDGQTALHLAVRQNKPEVVEVLLEKGLDVNASTNDSLTPVVIAAQSGNEEVVKLLLKQGANVDAMDKNGKTLLCFAVSKRSLPFVDLILSFSPDLSSEKNKETLKKAAYAYGDSAGIINSLLRYGLTVDVKDAEYEKLFHTAVEKNYWSLVDELSKRTDNLDKLINADPSKMLIKAVDKHCAKLVELLLNRGVDPNTVVEGKTVLHVAAGASLYGFCSNISRWSSGSLKESEKKEAAVIQEGIVKLLISCGADVNRRDKSGKCPLFYSIPSGNLNLCKMLLVDKNLLKYSSEYLIEAVKVRSKELVEILLKQGANPNGGDQRGSPLNYTVMDFNGEKDTEINGEVAKLLLSSGADINARTSTGKTTLEIAINDGREWVVEALLEYGVDVNARDVKVTSTMSGTPLILSATKSNVKITTMLLNKGAKVNATPLNCKKTALHIVSDRPCGFEKILEVLLNWPDVEVDCTDDEGRTPLHLAAIKGVLSTVSALLGRGADITIKDSEGKTPLDYAKEKNHTSVVLALTERSVD